MALNKLKFNSLNVTPTASKGIGFNSNADGLEATFSGGAMTFIKKLTASSSATLSFVDGSSDVVLDNTYKEYVFVFKDIHPGTNGGALSFQTSTDTGSSYGVTVTTTAFEAYHDEADSETALAYSTSQDLAQSTNFKRITAGVGSDNDQCCVGILTLFTFRTSTVNVPYGFDKLVGALISAIEILILFCSHSPESKPWNLNSLVIRSAA